jgi:hypothetical protein
VIGENDQEASKCDCDFFVIPTPNGGVVICL